MMGKGGNFFEKHVEKIAGGLIGLVCIWLLLTRVILSPNVVSYDDKKFGASEIDVYISKKAQDLENKLNRKPEPKDDYDPCLPDFIALVDSAIRDVDVDYDVPQPPHISRDVRRDEIKYSIPDVGEIKNVDVEHIRAVAYVPTRIVDAENPYAQDSSEPNDIDFVTVQAEFDVAELVKSFYDNFAGDDVRPGWRDQSLAEPVFAAVQLQRQRLGDDGNWGRWEIVPRTKIDQRRKMFEVIEDTGGLPAGGIKVRLIQFKDMEVQTDLLQPDAYCIASAKEEWFPPSLHKKFAKLQSEMELQEKREERDAQKEEVEREREERRSRTTRERSTTIGNEPSRMRETVGPGYPPAAPRTPATTRRTPTRSPRDRRTDTQDEREQQRQRPRDISKTTSDVYDEFEKIQLTEKSAFANMTENLVFWAYDDTVEPGNSYRYKVRLGVFNPVAGTQNVIAENRDKKNKVILWSEFSDITGSVTIPERLYFFPVDVQEATKTVSVTVSRYALGYWYSENFAVRQGEIIGRAKPLEKVEVSDQKEQSQITMPETIDYTTGALLVDVVPVNDWSGGKDLRERRYFDMLYSFDGTNIERLPVKSRYWTGELQAKFNDIKKLEKVAKEPLKPWSDIASRRGRPGVPRPGIERPYGPPEYMQQYMQERR